MDRPLRVLIIEDSTDDAELMVRELARGGFDPSWKRVETAEAMNEALENEAWDLVLTDFRLPRFGALAAIDVMRRREVDLPFLIVTDALGESAAVAAMKAGAHDVIMKDGLGRLMPAVERELREAGQRRKRRVAEEALRSSEAKFRRLIEESPDGVAVIRDGRIVYVNPVIASTLGYTSADDLVGRPIHDFIHPDDAGMVARRGRRIREGAGPARIQEMRFLRRDGGVVIAEVSPMSIEFDGAFAIAIIARDVTEWKQMQARVLLADRMASVGILAAGVAHEINNPLAYVIANLDFLREEIPRIRKQLRDVQGDAPSSSGNVVSGVDGRCGADLREVEETLREAREGAERVKQIVRDLKTFSRIDEETRGPVDLRRVIEAAINMAWPGIRPRARLVKQIGDTPPVAANESRLSQVFLNLLINAAQALPEGESEKNEIRVVARVDGRGRAIVEVGDTGPGIPRAHLNRIFDPFFTTKPVGVGTGLGLSICHSIVSGLGGKVEVETRLGQGTTFRVILSACSAESRGTNGLPAPGAPARARRGRILVIDDEPALGAALRRALSDHDVEVAHGGREGLDRLAQGDGYDLVLCDIIMPGMTGMDVYDMLRDARPDFLSRIVFMSSGACTARAQAFLARKEILCLEKPLDMKQLRDLVAERVRER